MQRIWPSGLNLLYWSFGDGADIEISLASIADGQYFGVVERRSTPPDQSCDNVSEYRVLPATGDCRSYGDHIPVNADGGQLCPYANRAEFPNRLITGIRDRIGEIFFEFTADKL